MLSLNKARRAVRCALYLTTSSVLSLAGGLTYAADSDEAVERITITGSSIKRTDLEGTLPVLFISREDIDRTGLSSVGDLIQNIPAMQGFTTTGDSVGGDGGGVVTASIHDLGEDYTLVLFNGRRLAPSGSGSVIDLNSIPLSAVERVEVLTDGASALYGSDAIAGVVNFIMKRNYQETELNLSLRVPQESGGSSYNGSITTGFGDVDTDGYNIMFSFSHDSQEQLGARERSFADTGIITFKHGDKALYFFNGSPNAIPGNAIVDYNIGSSEHSVFMNPYRNDHGSCAQNTSLIENWCWFDYTSTIEIVPESKRNSLLSNATFKIDDNTEGFVDFAYSDFSMTTRIAPYPSGGVPVGIDSPLSGQYIKPYLPNNADLVAVTGYWRALPASNRTTEWNTKSTHLVAGVDGALNELDYSAAFTYSVNDTDENYPAGWLVRDKFVDAVNLGEIDIFAPAGTPQPGLNETTYTGHWSNEKTVMMAVDAKASSAVFDLPGGEAYMGAGVEFRNYQYEQTISQANTDEIMLFLSSDTEYDLSRSVAGLFTELVMPVSDALEVTASLRYDWIGKVTDDKFADVNGHVSSKVVNSDESDITYKLSGRYKVNDNLVFRGSIGTGFKAPSMLEIAEPRVDFGVTSGNYDCPFSSDDALAELCKPGNQNQYNVFRQGNPSLLPETSEQYTFGLVYSASKTFGLSFDYWSIDMENLVKSIPEAQIFASPEQYKKQFSFKTNLATGIDELAILDDAVNVGKAEYEGIDWKFDFQNDLGFALLNTSLNGTYTMKSRNLKIGSDNVWETNLGGFGPDDKVTFRNVAQLNSTLSHDDFSHTAIIRYKSGYRDQAHSADDCVVNVSNAFGECYGVQLSISEYVTLDYQTRYQFDQQLSLTFGISNVLDEKPSLSLRTSGAGHQVGYDPRYVDSFGRTFYLSANYTF